MPFLIESIIKLLNRILYPIINYKKYKERLRIINFYYLEANIDSISLEWIDTTDKELLPDKGSVLKFKAILEYTQSGQLKKKVNNFGLFYRLNNIFIL